MIQRKKNAALKIFLTLSKSFDEKNLKMGFANSVEARAARDKVDEAFGNLCIANGELAAAIGGSWADIAEYKPAYMGDYEALRKKKDAVTDARITSELRKAKAAETRAKRLAIKTAKEAEEAAA